MKIWQSIHLSQQPLLILHAALARPAVQGEVAPYVPSPKLLQVHREDPGICSLLFLIKDYLSYVFVL